LETLIILYKLLFAKRLWLAVKILAFYIALHVFVNMIFIHLYDFLRFQVLALFLGLKFIDFQG